MFRFLKLWLLIRVLQDQEEHFIVDDNASPVLAPLGVKGSVGKDKFASYCSKKFLWLAILPLKWFRPERVSDYVKEHAELSSIRSIHSLIESARKYGYIEYGVKRNEGGELVEVMNRIRVSSEGDDFATYLGCVQQLLVKYKEAWILLTPSAIWIISIMVKFVRSNF